MDTLKEALAARAQTATLDELRTRGKRQVRVIRADDIAQMIAAAVEDTVAESGLMSPDEVTELVGKSRAQFRDLLERRQREVAELAAANEALEQCRAELQEARLRIRELERGEGGAASDPGGNAALMQYLMSEIADLRAKASAAPSGGAGAGDAITGALQQFTSTLNQKLESLGKKIGVSAATETAAPDLAALFKHGDDTKLESNMADMAVKAKTGAGITANLERLKKLKGGS